MGNDLRTPQQPSLVPLSTPCPYGQLYRVPNTDKTLLQLRIAMAEHQHYLQVLSRYKKYYRLKQRHILDLVDLTTAINSGFCGTSYSIVAMFQYSLVTLETEINLRKGMKKYMREKDLWSLIELMSSAAKDLEKAEHGDSSVRFVPKNVYICQDGTSKLINPLIEKNGSMSDRHTVEVMDSEYVSPERFQSSKRNAVFEEQKEQVFAMGMTVLAAATLEDCMECYNFRQGYFGCSLLEDLMDTCASNYSHGLLRVLCAMLQIDPAKRLTVNEVRQMVANIQQIETTVTREEEEEEAIMENQISYSQLQNLSQVVSKYPSQNSPSPVGPLKADSPTFKGCSSPARHPQPSNSSRHRLNSSTRSSHQESFTSESSASHQNQNLNDMGRQTSLQDISSIVKNRASNYAGVTITGPNDSLINDTFIKKIRKDSPQEPSILKSGTSNRIARPLDGFGRVWIGENGGFYEGNLVGGLFDGFGILYYKQGQPAYQGYWLNGYRNGEGVQYNQHPANLSKSFDCKDFSQIGAQWIYYRGSFKMDQRHGQGCLFLTNGQYYSGQFDDGMMHGHGEYHQLNNRVVSGTWVANRLTY